MNQYSVTVPLKNVLLYKKKIKHWGWIWVKGCRKSLMLIPIFPVQLVKGRSRSGKCPIAINSLGVVSKLEFPHTGWPFRETMYNS